jgi:hypothetical protein
MEIRSSRWDVFYFLPGLADEGAQLGNRLEMGRLADRARRDGDSGPKILKQAGSESGQYRRAGLRLIHW